MDAMGMTDSQFKGYVRFLLDTLNEVKEELGKDNENKRLNKVIENLQSTLED